MESYIQRVPDKKGHFNFCRNFYSC